MTNRELSQTREKLSSACNVMKLQREVPQSTLHGAGHVFSIGIKMSWTKPALSNHLWLSWRLDNRRGKCVCSITDEPDREDNGEETRGKELKTEIWVRL